MLNVTLRISIGLPPIEIESSSVMHSEREKKNEKRESVIEMTNSYDRDRFPSELKHLLNNENYILII